MMPTPPRPAGVATATMVSWGVVIFGTKEQSEYTETIHTMQGRPNQRDRPYTAYAQQTPCIYR